MERAVPILPADDLRVAKEYYVDRLGFDVRFEATDDGRTGLLRRAPANEPGGARTFDLIDPFGNTLFVIGPVKER